MKTAKEYAQKLYPNQDTWQRIAVMAFEEGARQEKERSKTSDVRKLEAEISRLKEVEKSYNNLVNNPELIVDYI